MKDDLAGRVIAVTGATGGIGRALCHAVAQRGAQVILLARNEARLRALHAELEIVSPGAALMAPLDLEKAVAGDYDRIAAAVEDRYGRLDGLVHCAALLGTLTPVELYEVPTWCRVMHVNVTAAFALTQVLLPALRRSPDASVIFTSSSVGRKGRAHWGAYAVSKFALEGLSESLAAEVAPLGISVTIAEPAPRDTLPSSLPTGLDAVPLKLTLVGARCQSGKVSTEVKSVSAAPVFCNSGEPVNTRF